MSDALKLIKQLAGLQEMDQQITEAETVMIYGYNSGNGGKPGDHPARPVQLKQLKMGQGGQPVAIVYDRDSGGDYEATWNSQLNGWTIDFD
jgi:hypothetical protein